MAIRLRGGAEFLHIPKTGGSWVETVLDQNGLIDRYLGHKHATYDANLLGATLTGRDQVRRAAKTVFGRLVRLGRAPHKPRPREETHPPVTEPLRFCFVRHPLAWLESFWRYQSGRGWKRLQGVEGSPDYWHPMAVLNGLGGGEFVPFVENLLARRPGYVSELFLSFAKADVAIVGRNESLRDDLAVVLDRLGLAYDRATVFDSERVNQAKRSREGVDWPESLREDTMRAELIGLAHFGYLSDEERERLGVGERIGTHPGLIEHSPTDAA